MKKKIGILLLLSAFVFEANFKGYSQETKPALQVEALKNLIALDPFKVTNEQGQSFDPSKGQELYFEDGTKLSFEKFTTYAQNRDGGYILIPYVNPANKNKVVAMLVRKASAEEKEALKAMMEANAQANTFTDGTDMNDPASMEAIKFDPNLRAEDFLKDLKKLSKKDGMRTMVNIGRVAIFDENGKLVPMEIEGKPNPEFNKITRNNDLSSDYYVDENNHIKAAVYRKATLEEKRGRNMITAGRSDNMDETTATAQLLSSSSITDEKGVELLGSKAKNFSATDIDGKKVSLDEFKGKKVVVLNFWFTRCKPCVVEMPHLNTLVDDFKGKDVVFLAIGNDNVEMINAFLKKNEFKYRIVPNGLGIANQYNVAGFPTHVIIDKKGKVVFLETSYVSGLEDRIKAQIETLLK
jgi:peroxiredoxin